MAYLLSKAVESILIVAVLSICTFGLIRIAPGGPLAEAERNPNVTSEQLNLLRRKYGLDQPLVIQYLRWMKQTMHGDLGDSLKMHRPVSTLIAERLPNTFALVGSALIITVTVAIILGTYCAVRQNSIIDYIITFTISIGQAIPVYWLGTILILVFYVFLHNPFSGTPLFPSSGMFSTGKQDNLLDRAWHLVLPVFTLTVNWTAWYSRYVRASMIEVLHSDYIRAARARGVPERLVIYRHGLINAAIPLITVIALDLPIIFGGALFIEIVFAWPGMGRLFWDAARARDYPILLAIVLINSLLIIIFNLLADVLYKYLDPRLRSGYKAE